LVWLETTAGGYLVVQFVVDSVSLAVSSSSWERRFLYSYERYLLLIVDLTVFLRQSCLTAVSSTVILLHWYIICALVVEGDLSPFLFLIWGEFFVFLWVFKVTKVRLAIKWRCDIMSCSECLVKWSN
jgi:hypothetical protein